MKENKTVDVTLSNRDIVSETIIIILNDNNKAVANDEMSIGQ